MRKFILIIICVILLSMGIGFIIGKNSVKPEEFKKIDIVITNEFINVREYANAYTDKLGQVQKGDKFKAIQKFEGNPVYNWYLIEYEKGKFGWIASEKEFPYVEEK